MSDRMPSYDPEAARLLHLLEISEYELKRSQKADAWVTMGLPILIAVVAISWIMVLIGFAMRVDLQEGASLVTALSIIFAAGCIVVRHALRSGLPPTRLLKQQYLTRRATYQNRILHMQELQYRLDRGEHVGRSEFQEKIKDPWAGYGW